MSENRFLNKEVIIAPIEFFESEDYRFFQEMSVNNQIDFLAKTIRDMVKKLKDIHGPLPIIVTWRESAITDKGNKFLNQDAKKLFKKTMQDLIDEFPDLNILAGPIGQ